MALIKIMCEILVLIALASVLSLTVNAFSPKGITLYGQWDVTKGVITADSNNNEAFHQREVDTVDEVRAIYMEGEALFVDARDDDSYAKGHIEGAVSLFVNDYDIRFDEFYQSNPDLNRLIITYCSGRECEDSHLLAEYLSDDGYTRVKVFIDGFPAWAKEGLPVETHH